MGKYYPFGGWPILFSCFFLTLYCRVYIIITPHDADYSWPAVWYFLIAATVFGCLFMLPKVIACFCVVSFVYVVVS